MNPSTLLSLLLCAALTACAVPPPDLQAGTKPAAAATSAAASPSTTAPTAGDDTAVIKVHLLGTGSPVPSPERFSNSTLVEVAGQRLLFDMGRGVTIRLWQLQIPFGTIDAHFITHMHSDHLNGLPDLWLTGWLQSPYGRRTSPMVVYGPKGTESMMHHLRQAFAEDIRIRTEDERFPPAGIATRATDIGPGVVYERGGVVVRAFDVDHGEHIKPSYGYKITYRGHAVVISGDTKLDPAVERAATGADLLIHEVAYITPQLVAAAPSYKAVAEHHTSPEEAGQLFSRARPRLAAYSHLVLPADPKSGIRSPSVAEIIAATRTTYGGPLVVGADLTTFEISASDIKVRGGTRAP